MIAPEHRSDRPSEPGPDPSLTDRAEYDPQVARRHRKGKAFAALALTATSFGVIMLVVLLFDLVRDGLGAFSWAFITAFPSRLASRAGVWPAVVGSVWILLLTAAISFPLGVGTAIWLEEYAPNNRLRRIIQLNISNLAAVPSIVYGILGLAVFVRAFAFGRSLLAGAATLALLILPVIIIAAQEAIRAVPPSIRFGAYALGATRWQVVARQVLPQAFPGIMTGTILALSRAIGETAPLIVIGAVGYVAFLPEGPLDEFTVLPIQIYDWIGRPQAEFHELAASAIVVLLIVLLSMNAVAILLRNRFQKDRNE
ncbi:MAG: phosphate ABC transporter permease PstA [Gammaproteobacteria bacterium]|nr:phosphate ABC transporter permease PstA [Gemmatimonadota bacterium]NIU74690.1 phosphate ABC transporter permease PstA [Gammaproteobacteria bacterium]NIW35605.1 phosphate ABC transporter permease PstA [Gemmatimonadota bacterium]